ncbi:MAG: hypothetical protein JXQ75_23635 [Phycisphaerae bacterium]|nr:hypothetical protein [Phycisphaerae bacterium]
MADSHSILEGAKIKLRQVASQNGLLDTEVSVLVTPLSAEEAIGQPTRRDFPIIEGKERVIEAKLSGVRGHAFTDSPRDFGGTLRDVLALPLSSNQNRAIFIAVLNVVLRSLDIIQTSVHCRDDDPEKCAKDVASHIREKWGQVGVGLVGLNPAIAEALVGTFGAENVRITDLNASNVQAVKFGVTIWDGRTRTEELVRQSSVVVVTGTTLVNGTFDGILGWVRDYGKDYLVYGVTAAGVCELMGLDRICPYGRSD